MRDLGASRPGNSWRTRQNSTSARIPTTPLTDPTSRSTASTLKSGLKASDERLVYSRPPLTASKS